MTTRIRVLVTIAIAVLSPGAFGQVSPDPPSKTVHISGRVTDATGAAIANATVKIKAPALRQPIATTETDENGAFTFRAAVLPPYELYFEATGFSRLTVPVKVPDNSTDIDVGMVVLKVADIERAALSGFASSTESWQPYTDKVLQVTFRYPKEWKTSAAYNDRTYFEGPDGSVQLDASEGDAPEDVCRGAATHHLRPYGAHPVIRSMNVQGRRACLVWPSTDQGAPWYAELIVEYPQPVEIDGYRYRLLILNADKNHILEISRTIRFLSTKGQKGAGAPPR